MPSSEFPQTTTPRRRSVLALTGALTLVGLTACTEDEASGDPNSSTPVAGGRVTYLTSDFPTSLDTTQTFSPYGPHQTVDTLVDQDPQSHDFVPWLATAWRVSDDGLTWTFDLRTDVTFSNGEELTAQLVKNNFDTLVALGAAGRAALPAAWLAGYSGSTVDDDHTVSISFDTPKAGFLQSVSEKPLAILAQETLDTDADRRAAVGVIGSGPFVITSYAASQEIVLTRRSGYAWAPSTAAHQGEAYLEEIRVQVVPEAGVRVGSLTSGQAAVVDGLSQVDIDTVTASGATVFSAIGGGTAYTLWPNLTRPGLSDVRVRRAISLGIDRQEVVDTVLTSYDRPAASILSSPVAGFLDLSDQLGHDPDQAAALLDEAGWTTTGAGDFRERDGRTLTLTAYYVYPALQPEFELIQQQLRAVGVDFQPRYVTSAELTSRRTSGDYDFLFWVNTRPDGDILVSNYSSTASDVYALAPQPDVDELLAAQTGELDVDRRGELLGEVQRTVVDRALSIPVQEGGYLVAARGLDGVRFTSKWIVFYDAFVTGN